MMQEPFPDPINPTPREFPDALFCIKKGPSTTYPPGGQYTFVGYARAGPRNGTIDFNDACAAVPAAKNAVVSFCVNHTQIADAPALAFPVVLTVIEPEFTKVAILAIVTFRETTYDPALTFRQ
jgi:hypothetical protein